MKLTADQIEHAFEEGLDCRYRREAFCEENAPEFAEYVQENFKNIIKEFEEHLHPNDVTMDLDAFEWTLFEMFLWKVLDGAKFDILARAFCESNWDRYKDFVSEAVHEESDGPDDDRDR